MRSAVPGAVGRRAEKHRQSVSPGDASQQLVGQALPPASPACGRLFPRSVTTLSFSLPLIIYTTLCILVSII
jgi:hypothetical protein